MKIRSNIAPIQMLTPQSAQKEEPLSFSKKKLSIKHISFLSKKKINKEAIKKEAASLFSLFQRKSVYTAAAVCLCLALTLTAYFRAMVLPNAVSAMAPSKKPLPIYSVGTEEKVVSISFDAAWGEEKTDEILKILSDRNIKTTFFLVGYWVDKYPERVKQIFDAGHEIGNHSATHPHMTQISRDQMIKELTSCSDKVERVTGVRPNLFRAPYGDYNSEVVTTSKEQGYTMVQWNLDSLDWKNKGVQAMVNQVVPKVENGSIILFHNNSEYITQALPLILDEIMKQGYKIVPVSELLLDGETYLDQNGVQWPTLPLATPNLENTPIPTENPAKAMLFPA